MRGCQPVPADARCRSLGGAVVTAQPLIAVENIVDRAGFAEALTLQRQTVDLSVRDLASKSGQLYSTLGGWFAGRHLPQRSQREAFLTVLRTCGVAEGDLDQW